MDILWPALGIAVVVVVVFYVLAQYWSRLLKEQSWTIRRLFERVQSLEDMADPAWRRRLTDASPVPLEQVFNFSFNLGERFWSDAVGLGPDDRKYIRDYGSFVGSVKLERWRSHTVATVTEVLPDRKASGWQTRSLDYYPDRTKVGDALSLWELALARPSLSADLPPSIELLLRSNSIELRGHVIAGVQPASGSGESIPTDVGDIVFFRVPLDPAALAEFRSHDPAESSDNRNGATTEPHANGNSWQAFYSFYSDELGIEWQLRLRDLTRKSEWERWKILDSYSVPLATWK
jgi:hypothetical protein